MAAIVNGKRKPAAKTKRVYTKTRKSRYDAEEAKPSRAPARGAPALPEWVWPAMGGLGFALVALLIMFVQLALAHEDIKDGWTAEIRYNIQLRKEVDACWDQARTRNKLLIEPARTVYPPGSETYRGSPYLMEGKDGFTYEIRNGDQRWPTVMERK